MKKCKWCNSNIEEDVTICPHCKAEQTSVSSNNANTNHVEKFLKSRPNDKTKVNNNTSYKTNKSYKSDENYIRQIAEDIRIIKNIIVVATVLYVIGTIYIAVNILGL